MKTLRLLTLALLVAVAGIAQTTQTQTYSDGITSAEYSVVGGQSGSPYTVIVCARTTDAAIDSFRVEYAASLPDGSEIRYDGFLLRRAHPSCQFVASTLAYPLLTGLVVSV